MADTKTLGQTYYEEVEALKQDGLTNADAVRAVAKKRGKEENAIRGGIHQYRRTHIDGGSTTNRIRRRAKVTADDFVANARQALEDALRLIDRDVDDAKAALDEAQANYDKAVASVAERKNDIEKKLNAWSS